VQQELFEKMEIALQETTLQSMELKEQLRTMGLEVGVTLFFH
jgi:hypothetical protein